MLAWTGPLIATVGVAALTTTGARAEASQWPAVSALSSDVANLVPPPAGYAQAGADLTSAYMTRFWNRSGGQIYSAPERSAETVPGGGASGNGYTLWPSLLGLHGLVEGERQRPGAYSYWIWQVYSGLERYWNSDWHCYMAWTMFPGNDDSYYDDNAWAVITLVEAYEATRTSDPQHAHVYLDRVSDIMNTYEVRGWDAGNLGGVRWGTSSSVAGSTDRTVSATAGSALAAFMLHRAGRTPSWGGTWLQWGTGALNWIMTRLRDTDQLIMDGFRADGSLLPTKWTYNTGVTIRALVERYRATGDKADLANAQLMGRAAIDHRGALFDGLVTNPDKRFWYDAAYFVHYLADGLLRLREATSDAGLRDTIRNELAREAAYIYNYIRDPFSGDNMYWRNMRLWRIGPYQQAVWEQITGQRQPLDQDPAEMVDGRYVKTLLANAGIARFYWQVGPALDR